MIIRLRGGVALWLAERGPMKIRPVMSFFDLISPAHNGRGASALFFNF